MVSLTRIKRRYFLLGTGIALAKLNVVIASTLIASCQPNKNSSQQLSTVKVGITQLVPEDILKFVQKELAVSQNLNVQLIKFSDGILANNALNSGEIDAYLGQHQAFMENIAKRLNLDLVMHPRIFSYVFGLYSKRLQIKSIDELSPNASVGIANDPINQDRGLRLLRVAGLIKLRDNSDDLFTIKDIKENPKNLRIQGADGTSLVRALDDLDVVALYATSLANAKIKLDPILIDPTNLEEKYKAGLTTLRSKANDSNIKKLDQLVVHPKVKDFIANTYQGTIAPAF
ncbi:NLPA lipoprotein [Nostoc sp. FACHB-152]|uniref:MetQ/NlpA family ABC transporter substrate-binding protein n=1 Tax=unclassified Nostoc TaxID=2593658 RepID=UPI0016849201|nr:MULTISPECIES: MetQ/NlpA family ABC transporter substrate-binding protein [unclassified Nostoc]MBD2451876.1 NLPA lipoprotein [Nostoc sp. FACHB-152]MBD2469119.1 NLPA lipoprotein [Nostoc sp. FACHB-145]